MFEALGTHSVLTTIFYVVAAVLPATILMRYVYRLDRVEKEPKPLLYRLILGGVLAAFMAMLLETVGEAILSGIEESVSNNAFQIMTATMVGLSEEYAKLHFLKRYSWNNGHFNFRFDGVVYAIFVSLGFAAFENILYVFSYGGIEIALQRAILSIPAHMSFAVYMGIFYGRAKMFDVRGNRGACSRNLWLAYIIAVSLHAFYDGTLMVGTEFSFYLFIGYIILMYTVVFQTLRRQSYLDMSIY